MEREFLTVGDLIRFLEVYDQEQPVYVKKYGCGSTWIEELSPEELDVSSKDKFIILMDYN